MAGKLDNFGVGIDIEDIARFQRFNLESNVFLNKIYTPNELKYCFSKNPPFSHLAVRFAAKEAVIKAAAGLGVTIKKYTDIEIVRNKEGVPMIKLTGRKQGLLKLKISLSHSDDKAVAVAIIIK